jgi:Ribonuclease G/E
MMTVRTFRNTPVVYRGATYRIDNLEVGDKIRVEAEPRTAQNDEITARRIVVVQSVQDSGTAPDAGGRVTTISGRVTRIESGLDRVYIDTGREEVRVDMAQAEDADGGVVRARDLRVDDRVEITGSFNRVGDMFNASTVRFTDGGREVPGDTGSTFDRPALVTTGGTITETLEDASTLGVRETDTNRVVRIWISPDLVVKLKNNTYTTASTLREKDTVIIQAYRDGRGNLIAQTVRVRNR